MGVIVFCENFEQTFYKMIDKTTFAPYKCTWIPIHPRVLDKFSGYLANLNKGIIHGNF